MKFHHSFLFLLLFTVFGNVGLNGQSENIKNVNDNKFKQHLPLPKPLLREIEFKKPRAYPNVSIPAEARHNAIKQAKQLSERKFKSDQVLAAQPEWKCIGPGNIGGRIKSLAIHPTNPNLVYAAAAAGGIWKTTNGGTSWKPIFDFENAIAFGSISLDKNNPETLYAGTGEAVMGGGQVYLGTGMYKSTDAGESWFQIGLTQCGAFSKVYVHPKNSDIVVAGAVIRSGGFYLSKNAGMTWEKLLEGNISDITINPNDENEYFIAVSGDGIYSTQNMGANWARRTSGISLAGGIGRISVSMSKSNPNVLYSLVESGTQGVAVIYKTANKGATWQQSLYDNYSNDDYRSFFRGQGFYDNFIEVHLTDENIAVAGGIDIWRTSNGSSWTNITRGYQGGSVHVDQHCGLFAPSNPSILYIGNDGGIYKSGNAGVSFTAVNNGLYITQFYAMAIDVTKKSTNYGGTQDNGVVGGNSANWNDLAGGDGFTCIVDRTDPNMIYSELYYGRIIKIDISSNPPNVDYAVNGIPESDTGAWHSPFIYSVDSPTLFYTARHGIYFSDNRCNSWNELLPMQPNKFTSLEFSYVDQSNAYAGNERGELYLTHDEGMIWTIAKNKGLPNRYITSIRASKKDKCVAYITYSGYGTSHVFRTSDCGETWTNISLELPDVPCNDIEIHPDNENWLFLATDVGVFASFDAGASWTPFGKDLPRSPVLDLAFHTNRIVLPEITLRAATHGRSIWEVVIPDEQITDLEIVSPAGGELYIGTTNQVISWSGFTPPVRVEYSLNGGSEWTQLASEAVGTSMRWLIPDRTVTQAFVRVTSVSNPSQTKISRSFSILKKVKGAVIGNSSVYWVPYGLAYDGDGGLWTTSFYSNILYKLNCDDYSILKEIELPEGENYTDITIDKENKFIFLHKMHSEDGGGGYIYVLDFEGNILSYVDSPAKIYPTGLTYLDGKLIVGERDPQNEIRKLFVLNPENWEIENSYSNPFQGRYGPRCLCNDGNSVYQVSTLFPSGSLTGAYVLKIGKAALSTEVDRFSLESENGLINARGIEFDPRDKNFWLSDFSGNLYKIAGFDIETSVGEVGPNDSVIEAEIYPNPSANEATLSFKLNKSYENVKIQIFNMLGENIGTVFDRNTIANIPYNININTGLLPGGVYYASICADGTIVSVKSLYIIR